MMKYTLLFLLLFPGLSFAQCAYEDILVFEHGITKFDAIKISKTTRGFSEGKSNTGLAGMWHKLDYLNDSVFKDEYHFEVSNLQCYKLNSCNYSVYFADDKLFKQIVTVEFTASNFSDYNEIYGKLIQLFRLEFNFSNMIDVTHPETNIKIGEGYIFRDIESTQPKVNHVQIHSVISYIHDTEKGAITNEIDKYVITIKSVDLGGTKMDSRGY